MDKYEDLLRGVTGLGEWSGGYLEVVTDLNSSIYFDHEHITEAIQYASKMSEAGHEVHFGPAVRKNDLGAKRSDRANILWVKCLWIDIDSPDKSLPAEERLEAAEKLKDDFVEALKMYDLEPSFIVCSGNGYHIYFVLRRGHGHD